MIEWLGSALLSVFVWPGAISGALLAWFFMWLARKFSARLQGRFGPPFYQPFFDFVKLLGKKTLVPEGVSPALFFGLPVSAVIAMVFALALLPLPGNQSISFAGDLILLVYLMEMPALCTVIAGFSSRSLYGQVSSSREAVLLLGYNLPFLASVVALAVQANSFRLTDLANQPWTPVHIAAALAFLIAVPARLRTNPFSIPNAEQEIVGGAMTEFNGTPLALFELAHGLELVALVGLFNVLFIPVIANHWLALLVYLLVSAVLVILISVVATATARVQLSRALRFYWGWGAAAAVLAFVLALVL